MATEIIYRDKFEIIWLLINEITNSFPSTFLQTVTRCVDWRKKKKLHDYTQRKL